jgi:hypothetical protein
MRCVCCNKQLSDYESTRRHAITRDFLDMCNTCYTSVQDSVPSKAREDLEEKTVDNIEEACYPYFKDYEEQSSLE